MSNCTNSTMNRGVEAKEIEIANARLDLEGSDSTGGGGCAECGGCAGDAGEAPLSPPPASSYLQVVVEKHRRKQPAVRRPTASSPAPAPAPVPAGCTGDAGEWPRGTVLLACPASLTYYMGGGTGGTSAELTGTASAQQPSKAQKSWYMFGERGTSAPDVAPEDKLVECCGDDCDPDSNSGEVGCGEPASVEVYRFERVGAWLSSAGARPTRVAARAARATRAADRAAAEVAAVMRLITGAPFMAAALVARVALQTATDAASTALSAASDLALKPALALLFNAVLHPPLVFIGNVLRGVRAALRPGVLLLSECAGAVAVLLRAVRLVDLHYTTAPCPTCRRPPLR